MKKFFPYTAFLIIVISICTAPADLAAQHHLHDRHVMQHPALKAIEQAVLTGEISQSEAILQKVYYGLKPESADGRFLAGSAPPLKCLTPVMQEFYQLQDELNPAVVAEIEELVRPQTTSSTQSHLSPSGHFILYYDTEGNHAVPLEDSNASGIPDYVEHGAFAADSSYRYQVQELGFVDFLREEPYEISFRNIGTTYGMAHQAGSTTRITVHNNFDGFPPNTHPEGHRIGALYATIAHEIKHAVQYATNRWHGQAGSFDWIEMDATLMEEVVFPDVNDYYNYIMSFDAQMDDWNRNSPHNNSVFGNPQNPTPGAYWHVSWMLYFFETFGMEFWVDVWEQFIEERQKPFIEAMDVVLNRYGSIFEREHITNHLWHMTSGPDHSPGDFGFEDRLNYPTSRFEHTLFSAPDSLNGVSLRSLAAHYVDVQPSNVTIGQPMFSVTSTVPGVGLGVIGYFRDGTTDAHTVVNPNSNTQTLQTTWSWADLMDLKIAVVNTNRESSADYSLTVTSIIPDEDTISQNYPNPFNPTTRIEFSLSETKDVRIDVYDSVGRRVATLLDERRDRGYHFVTFDGSGLASGMYIYRIVTDQGIVSRKMMLIK